MPIITTTRRRTRRPTPSVEVLLAEPPQAAAPARGRRKHPGSPAGRRVRRRTRRSTVMNAAVWLAAIAGYAAALWERLR